jgi:hypothetical protein
VPSLLPNTHSVGEREQDRGLRLQCLLFVVAAIYAFVMLPRKDGVPAAEPDDEGELALI